MLDASEIRNDQGEAPVSDEWQIDQSGRKKHFYRFADGSYYWILYHGQEIKQELWATDEDLIHRVNGPAHTAYKDGYLFKEEWRQKDQVHRIDGPAKLIYNHKGEVIKEEWLQNYRWHRIGGPAVREVQENRMVETWFFEGHRHRTDGPSCNLSSYFVYHLFGVEVQPPMLNKFHTDRIACLLDLAKMSEDYARFIPMIREIDPVLAKSLQAALRVV